MLSLVKVISSDYDKFKKRIVKVLRFGRNDVQTGIEANPYGLDSNPIKDMVAVYAPTNERGKTVIIGYLNKTQLAEPGEFRTFSTNAAGVLMTYTWLKANGDLELGGSTNNLVKYALINQGLQQQVLAINAELGKIATAINSIVPGLYVPVPITLDITLSKTDKVKVL